MRLGSYGALPDGCPGGLAILGSDGAEKSGAVGLDHDQGLTPLREIV